jgi:hypothetical protein
MLIREPVGARPPAPRIDSEHHDVVVVLVGGNKYPPADRVPSGARYALAVDGNFESRCGATTVATTRCVGDCERLPGVAYEYAGRLSTTGRWRMRATVKEVDVCLLGVEPQATGLSQEVTAT